MAERNTIQLGDTIRDTITGVQGVVVCISKWLNGCETLTVQKRELDKDGRPHDRLAFDVEQVALVEAEPRALPGLKRTGGDAQVARSGRE